MSSVKENIIKIKVLAALMGWTFWRTTEGQWIDGLLSVMVEYLRRNTTLLKKLKELFYQGMAWLQLHFSDNDVVS